MKDYSMLKKFDQETTEGILFTDQYQLVMAQLYFKLGLHEKKVQFDHFFRNYPDYGPHKAGYCINAGLEWFIDWMMNSSFRKEDIEFMQDHKTQNGEKLFHTDFLNWLLKDGNFDGFYIKAVPEGRVVHPHTPLTTVWGPLALAQILETSLLNQLNFQTLIATKASRIKETGNGQPLIDFGARRAQDRAANAGARAALIGGADFSSNVGISYVLGYPPKGTHAHSMVQVFLASGSTEEDAFTAFAELYPDDCILLVDTIDTLASGIPNAIKVFEKLKKKGHRPAGIRLDSGDLAYLSIMAARLLDQAGFEDVKIVLSNELDELNILQIITQLTFEAPKYNVDPDKLIKRLIYGVGTKLITSAGDAALGGVYKLVGMEANGIWKPAIKISESNEKIPNPGRKCLRRLYDKNNNATADLLTLEDEEIPGKTQGNIMLHHSWDHAKTRILQTSDCKEIEQLQVDIIKDGKIVYDFPSIEVMRIKRASDLERLDPGVKRLINPHLYHVSISQKLWELKQELINEIKG
ncbi:MAG: nicotinate phosphoribosyltransferase [Ignavibacteria bacterium]